MAFTDAFARVKLSETHDLPFIITQFDWNIQTQFLTIKFMKLHDDSA